MDFEILYRIQEMHNAFLDPLMIGVSALGNGGLIWLLAAAVLLFFRKTRRCGMLMLISMAVCFLLGNLWIKNLGAKAQALSDRHGRGAFDSHAGRVFLSLGSYASQLHGIRDRFSALQAGGNCGLASCGSDRFQPDVPVRTLSHGYPGRDDTWNSSGSGSVCGLRQMDDGN